MSDLAQQQQQRINDAQERLTQAIVSETILSPNVEFTKNILPAIAGAILKLEGLFFPTIGVMARQIEVSRNVTASLIVLVFHIILIIMIIYIFKQIQAVTDCAYIRMVGTSNSDDLKPLKESISSDAYDVSMANAKKAESKHEGAFILSIVYYLTWPLNALSESIPFISSDFVYALRRFSVMIIQGIMFVYGTAKKIVGLDDDIMSNLYCGVAYSQ